MPLDRSTAVSEAWRSAAFCRGIACGLVLAWIFGNTTLTCAQSGSPSPSVSPTELLKGGFVERPISLVKASIALPAPDAPANMAAPQLENLGIRYQPTGLGRGWCLQPFEWEPTALAHLPLYFEEPNLERLGYYYGHPCDGRVRRYLLCNITEYMATVHDDSYIKQWYFECQCRLDNHQCQNQLLQPFVSAAHFFGRVPALPYMMGACCPEEPVYTLGADRPGSPVPYRKYYMPLSLKGILYQGAAITGLAYAVP